MPGGHTRRPPIAPAYDPRRVEQMERAAEEPIDGVVADAERRAQAQFEGADATDFVEFYGSKYLIADRVGLMPLLKFAHAASKGTDSGDIEGMAAMYEMLRACFYRGVPPCGTCQTCRGYPDAADGRPTKAPDPENCPDFVPDEWDRFEEHAVEVNADDQDLFEVVTSVIEIVQARPTRRRSGSSPRAPRTSPNSKGNSSSPAAADGLRRVSDLI